MAGYRVNFTLFIQCNICGIITITIIIIIIIIIIIGRLGLFQSHLENT